VKETLRERVLVRDVRGGYGGGHLTSDTYASAVFARYYSEIYIYIFFFYVVTAQLGVRLPHSWAF
jgi:hypothetical protein